MEHFHLKTHEDLLRVLGDDFRHVAPAYAGPELRTFPDGTWEGLWGERYTHYNFGKGTYPEAVYLPFMDISDASRLKDLRMPSADWYDYSTVKRDCEKWADYVIIIEGAGTPDFMNGIARCRGVGQVLLDIGTEDPVYLELCKQRFEFFYERIERTLEAAGGLVDVVCLGEDLGNQSGIMISPRKFDKLFSAYMRELFALAHKYGAKTMMHSCGSVRDLIPRLIELGLDILEVVQVDAAKMDIRGLHRDFHRVLGFCGSISVQTTLPFGTVADVVREVELRKELFKEGGMVIAATHDIQVGTPIENILAMYEAIGSLEQACASS
jgi:uroporphyrinogen decarboxylase